MKPEHDEERAEELAVQHVNWWISSIRTPMMDEFVHGYGHGFEDGYQRGREDALKGEVPHILTQRDIEFIPKNIRDCPKATDD